MFLFILMSLAASVAMVGAGLMMVNSDGEGETSGAGFIGCFLIIVGVVALVANLCAPLASVQSYYKASVINEEFGTDYSTAEVFFAEDVIEEIRYIKRDRKDINLRISKENTKDTLVKEQPEG